MRPPTIRRSVDFPQPLGPMSVTNSLSGISSEISRKASTEASRPWKVLVTRSTTRCALASRDGVTPAETAAVWATLTRVVLRGRGRHPARGGSGYGQAPPNAPDLRRGRPNAHRRDGSRGVHGPCTGPHRPEPDGAGRRGGGRGRGHDDPRVRQAH